MGLKRERQRKGRRESQNRPVLSETWLFVSEGSKTEPKYIESLVAYANGKTSVSKLKPKFVGTGRNTTGVVKVVDDLLAEIDMYKIKGEIHYAKIFVLFDLDSFEEGKFNTAVKMCEAKKRGYIPIWSNECFELWYLLHYDFLDGDIGRKQYYTILSEKLGVKYKENKSMDVFTHIQDKISTGLKNAEKLRQRAKEAGTTPAESVPCTQMPRLVRELESLLKIKFEDFCDERA